MSISRLPIDPKSFRWVPARAPLEFGRVSSRVELIGEGWTTDEVHLAIPAQFIHYLGNVHGPEALRARVTLALHAIRGANRTTLALCYTYCGDEYTIDAWTKKSAPKWAQAIHND